MKHDEMKQEPVAWQWLTTAHFRKKLPKDAEKGAWNPLYTTPQPKQEQGEPMAWESVLGTVARGWCYEENANKTMDFELAVAIAKEVHALYTTPQQRTWVGLTEEEKIKLWDRAEKREAYQGAPAFMALIQEVETKLKDKNL